MKQKIHALFILLLLLPVLIFSASARQNTYVIDNADLLSDTEEAALEAAISDFRNAYEIDIVILTEPSLNGQRPQEHTDDYYDSHGYGQDGVLLLLSMEEREWYLSTCGDMIYVLTDYGIQDISQRFLGDLSAGAYYEGFLGFLNALPEYLDAFLSGSPVDGYGDYGGDYYHGDREDVLYYEESFHPSFLLSLVIGLVAALVTVLIMRGMMRTGKRQRSAGMYMKENSYRITGHRDLFLYSNVSKVRKPQNNSSGGGSSVHRSSGGRRHGGGGGRF